MTDAQVNALLAVANSRGRDISSTDVRHFLVAKAILQFDPGHEMANKTVREFVNAMEHGGKIGPAGFLLPLDGCETDEEIAAGRESRERYLAAMKAKQAAQTNGSRT